VKQSKQCADLYFSVTENGFAVKDEYLKPMEDALQDTDRVNYFKGITNALKDAALEDGVDVRAYFPWSMYFSHSIKTKLFLYICASTSRRFFG